MLGKKAKSRVLILITSLVFVVIVIFIIFKSLEKNIVYFFSPTDISNESHISSNEKIRIGGLVKEGSVYKNETTINFIITDNKSINTII